ncbi:indolepyruvate ferredoxin oxidoreductase family protein [Streptomyces malaysiensis]|uniref:indolepyruvate ferredoxin oxidoreductase family protein n=1 Tax=Streptomyces malaysiensis TaxID=92644 RepID=UPI00372224C8
MGAVANDAARASDGQGRSPLEDRYDLREGTVRLSGMQALVRLPLDQRRLDESRDLNIGIFISGYEGSPLAGYDLQLTRQGGRLADHRVVFSPSVNEELAAAAVQGTQFAAASPERIGDGAVGIWYGKAPGLDRATDAIRHGNLVGTHPRGGVLALVGDDSIAKSSTVPSGSEAAIAELGMPCLSPSDPQDILDLGLHGVAMSRACGLWVAMKLATNVVDGSQEVRLDPSRIKPVEPDRTFGAETFEHTVTAQLLQPTLGRLEATQVRQRLELARRYAAVNGLNRIEGDPEATLGIVCAGATYREVRQALSDMGIGADAMATGGLRVLKLGLINPLEPAIVTSFSEGLSEILVIEEKKAFIELAVKDLLYGAQNPPRIHGKRDEDGTELFRADSDLPADYIAARLAPRIIAHGGSASAQEWLDRQRSAKRVPTLLPILPRTPYFCSGCPHNRSTQVPDGALVGGGIGCHALITLLPEERVGTSIGLFAMGGEGAPWTGMSPFVSHDHIFQNLGDGTYHHSGSLAIRAAISSGTNMTYKLLYNDTVAMTGGQDAVGKMPVPRLTEELLAEGVKRVVITSDAPKASRRAFGWRLPKKVSIRHRDELIEVQEELAAVQGVTVLIHHQECATELRRKRKRGLVESPPQRIVINERVCEGCGDCGDKSNCLSVRPVDTVFGRKTQIHQASCNLDFSCVKGDCPSFVEVVPRRTKKTARDTAKSPESAASPNAVGAVGVSRLPDPVAVVGAENFSIRLTGVGGTGVVTVAQVLAEAAHHVGLKVTGLDQLGLAQKGGAVISDLRMSSADLEGSNKIGSRGCDLYLGLDILVAASQANLEVTSAERTYAVVSTSIMPTGAMITDPRASFPERQELIDRIEWAGPKAENVFVDARAELRGVLEGDQYANVFLLGVAVQAGLLPLPPSAIEWALGVNGVQVAANREAFRHGRRFVVDRPERAAAEGTHGISRQEVDAAGIAALVGDTGSAALCEIVRRCVSELIAYQNPRYARGYASAVERMRVAEAGALGTTRITEDYARQLYKVLAYKDEYEVARLSLAPALKQRIDEQFGAGSRYYYLLHPPILRALGLKRKIRLNARWATYAFQGLYAMRALRGTPFDVFGLGKVRRAERALIANYTHAADTAAAVLSPSTADVVAELVSLPEWVRGYEGIKLDSLQTYYDRQDELLSRLPADSSSAVTARHR